MFTSLSPNTFATDLWLALRVLLTPWSWLRGSSKEKLKQAIAEYHDIKHVFLFDSGRTGWHAILEQLLLQPDDEVLLQAATCVVVPNPVIWSGLKPIYVDFQAENYNLDPADVEKKITSRSRVLLLQHTFGAPVDWEPVKRIAAKHNLIIIEDLAHALGSRSKSDAKPVGTLGQAAFLSFGRDKIISSVFGGAVITNDDQLAAKLAHYEQSLQLPNHFWILQQLLHPLIFSIVLPFYHWYIGKVVLVLAQKLKLLSKAVYPEEKQGQCHSSMPRQLPNALAALALHQFNRLAQFNQRRREIAERYRQALQPLTEEYDLVLPYPQWTDIQQTGAALLRYTIQVPHPQKLHALAKKRKIQLGDWYDVPLIPHGTDYQAAQYKNGSCPQVESITPRLINLPTAPKLTDSHVEKVIALVKEYFSVR